MEVWLASLMCRCVRKSSAGPKCVHSREFGASVRMLSRQWRAVGSSHPAADLELSFLLQETRAENH